MTFWPSKLLSTAWFTLAASGGRHPLGLAGGPGQLDTYTGVLQVTFDPFGLVKWPILWQPTPPFFDPGQKTTPGGCISYCIEHKIHKIHKKMHRKTHFFEVTDPRWQQILSEKTLSGGWDLDLLYVLVYRIALRRITNTKQYNCAPENSLFWGDRS